MKGVITAARAVPAAGQLVCVAGSVAVGVGLPCAGGVPAPLGVGVCPTPVGDPEPHAASRKIRQQPISDRERRR